MNAFLYNWLRRTTTTTTRSTSNGGGGQTTTSSGGSSSNNNGFRGWYPIVPGMRPNVMNTNSNSNTGMGSGASVPKSNIPKVPVLRSGYIYLRGK